MNIIVCVKQVTDPEAPASSYIIDTEAKRITMKGVPPVISPFDENALEAALRIKDTLECKVTVISAGEKLAKPVLTKALAAGADELLIIEDIAFQDMDSYTTASALVSAIKKLGQYDLILTGRQAADTNAGIVGSGIAELLGIPCVTGIRKVEVSNGKVIVERIVSDGYEVVEAPFPSLFSVSNELGELRYPALQQIIAAKKKPISTLNAQELGIDPSQMRQTTMLKLFAPQRETQCEMLAGNTPDEAGANLALKLREAKVL